MRNVLQALFPAAISHFFEDAGEMIDWLKLHLAEVMLISLDHDLPFHLDEEKKVDCGTGRQVADYLVAQTPTSPVIVHSSNVDCAAGMYFALLESGWPVFRVYPTDDLGWIQAAWGEEILRLKQSGWL